MVHLTSSSLSHFSSGHDWGSLIVSSLCSSYPNRCVTRSHLAVSALTLSPSEQAPLGLDLLLLLPRQLSNSYYLLSNQLLWLPEFLLTKTRYLERLWADWQVVYSPIRLASVQETFSNINITTAAVNFYRVNLPGLLGLRSNPRWTALLAALSSPVALPTLNLVGDSDGCIVPEIFMMMHRAAGHGGSRRDYHGKVISPNCGHFLHNECLDQTVVALIQFLKPYSRFVQNENTAPMTFHAKPKA